MNPETPSLHKFAMIFDRWISNACVILASIASATMCVAGPLDWQIIHTPTSDIYFKANWEWKARRIAGWESDLTTRLAHFVTVPSDRVSIVVDDYGQLFNGTAEPIQSRIRIMTGRPRSIEWDTHYQDMDRLMLTHEMTHIGQLMMVASQDRWIRNLAGMAYSPVSATPEWFIEGMAVAAESSSPLEGRLNDGGVADWLHAMSVSDQLPTLVALTAPDYRAPYHGLSYWVGGAFLQSLCANRPDALLQWNQEIAARPLGAIFGYIFPSTGIDGAAQVVFGQTVPELYSQWQLARQRDSRSSRYRVETATGGEKTLLTSAPDGTLFFIQESRRYPAPFNWKENRIELVEFNPKTHALRTVSRLPQRPVAPLVVGRNQILTVLKTTTTDLDNHSNQGVGETGAVVAIDRTTGQVSNLWVGPVAAVAVHPTTGALAMAIPRLQDMGSQIGEIQRGRWTPIVDLPVDIGELMWHDDRIVAVARTAESPWGLISIDPKTGAYRMLWASEWAATKVSRAGNRWVFTTTEKGTLNTIACDLDGKNPVRLTVSGNAGWGVRVDDTVYTLSVIGNTVEVMSQPALSIRVTENRGVASAKLPISNDPVAALTWDDVVPFRRVLSNPIDGVGLSLGAEDPLGLVRYAVRYDGTIGLEMGTALPSPVRVSAVITGWEGPSVIATTPVHRGALDGVRTVDGAVLVDSGGIKLVGMGSARWGDWRSSAQAGSVLATGGWGTTLTQEWIGDVWILTGMWTGIDRYSLNYPVAGAGRRAASSETGSWGRTEVTAKVSEFQMGIWEPNLFVGNGFVRLYGLWGSWAPRSQIGVEGSVECLGGMNRLHIEPKVGLAVQDGVFNPYVEIEAAIGFF